MAQAYTFKIKHFLNADKERVDSPVIIEHGGKEDENYILMVAGKKTVDGILVPDAPCKALFDPDDELKKVKLGQLFLATLKDSK